MQIHDLITCLKGIGPKTADVFRKLNIYTILDLLKFYPRTYLSYEEPLDIASAEIGTRVAIKATIQSYVEVKKIRKLTLVTCLVKDFSGSVKCLWFNSPFLKQVFHIGQTYIFVGTISVRNHQRVLEHPEYYKEEEYMKIQSSLQPVYSLTEGLSNKIVAKAVKSAISVVDQLTDTMPESFVQKFDLVPLKDAVIGSHFPRDYDELMQSRKRLIFDEFFWFILKVRMLRERTVRKRNYFVIQQWQEVDCFIQQLPFSLTNGQIQAINEIRSDLTGTSMMNRLVQGDVGSGKTIVAQMALLATVKSGFQAAFMVPTEVLAMQHYKGICDDFVLYGVRVALLVGSTKLSEKRKIYEALKNGEIDIIVGTHALIQEKVMYKNLALVITDEQHRFGVRQRELLSEKGNCPHVLVMSATPIPRTLAIIMYGDLDISIIKDMPASRKPIKNCVVGSNYRPTAYKFMLEQIRMGHQIYIICPMVESSENVDVENVMEYHQDLVEKFPKDIRISYLHGKMSQDEKNTIMHMFSHNEIDILVSTTVIEVGINNPNATVIMIENAEKFGLAQLHQLRGRVGRGHAQSYCIMMCTSNRKEAQERLQILNSSNDGFYIANEDLKLRGPGDFFGVRQSGDMTFKLGDIYNHADILKQANEAVLLLEHSGTDLEELLALNHSVHIQL